MCVSVYLMTQQLVFHHYLLSGHFMFKLCALLRAAMRCEQFDVFDVGILLKDSVSISDLQEKAKEKNVVEAHQTKMFQML